MDVHGSTCPLINIQWYLRFKTAHLASKIWSQIEGGLKIEAYLYWKYTSGITDIQS